MWPRSKSTWARWKSSSGPASPGQEPERRIERSRLEARLGRGQGPLRPPRRVHGQRDRALQERGRGRGPPRAWARPAERSSSAATSSSARGGQGPVPGPAVRVGLRLGGLGQGAMQLLVFLERCRPVGRRPNQGMPEPHAAGRSPAGRPRPPDRGLRACQAAGPPATAAPGRRPAPPPPQHQRRVSAGRTSSRRGSSPRSGPTAAWRREGRTRPPARRGQAPGQLHQRQRVTAGLGDDPVADRGVQWPGQHRVQQRPGISLLQSFDHQFRQSGQLVAGTRAANTRPTDSAARRRATNPRTWAEA